MAFSDEREIDDWFEEEKEMLTNKLYADLEKMDDSKARALFDKAFFKLLDEYEQKYLDFDASKKRHEKLSAPLKRLRGWWDAWLAERALRKKRREEIAKKERFDREYRKLFKENRKP